MIGRITREILNMATWSKKTVVCSIHDFVEVEELHLLRSNLLGWYDSNKRTLPWRTVVRRKNNCNHFLVVKILFCSGTCLWWSGLFSLGSILVTAVGRNLFIMASCTVPLQSDLDFVLVLDFVLASRSQTLTRVWLRDTRTKQPPIFKFPLKYSYGNY